MPRFIIKKCLCPPCNEGAHDWEFRTLLLSEARIVQAKTGIKGNDAFGDAIAEEDPEAWTALIDIMHRRSGIAVRWEEIDCDMEQVDVQMTDEEMARLTPEQRAELEAAMASGKDPSAEGTAENPASGSVNGAALTPKWPSSPVNSGVNTG